MMRSGLQTPGASPFLTLLFFSLLSLVLSWSGRGYGGGAAGAWSWYGYGGKNTLEPTAIYDFPRVVKNPQVVDGMRARTGGSGSGRPAVLPSSFETGSIVSPSQSSTLTRVHAFFIQRLDGSQLLPQFSTRGRPVETPSTPSKPSQDGVSPGEHITSDGQFGTWQRVCQVVTDFYTYALSSPVKVNEPDTRPLDVDSNSNRVPKARADTQTVIASDSQDAAAGRIPEHARGSCMAIVVSLVVGIMWF